MIVIVDTAEMMMEMRQKVTDEKGWAKSQSTKEGRKGYGIALALGSTLIALLVRWSLDFYLQDSLPYLTFFFAIAVTTWYSGTGTSLVTFVLGGLLTNWFFVAPRYEFSLVGPVDQAGMAVYVTIGFAMIGFVQTWRWAWRRTDELAEKLQHELHQRDQLIEKPTDAESKENQPAVSSKL